MNVESKIKRMKAENGMLTMQASSEVRQPALGASGEPEMTPDATPMPDPSCGGQAILHDNRYPVRI